MFTLKSLEISPKTRSFLWMPSETFVTEVEREGKLGHGVRACVFLHGLLQWQWTCIWMSMGLPLCFFLLLLCFCFAGGWCHVIVVVCVFVPSQCVWPVFTIVLALPAPPAWLNLLQGFGIVLFCWNTCRETLSQSSARLAQTHALTSCGNTVTYFIRWESAITWKVWLSLSVWVRWRLAFGCTLEAKQPDYTVSSNSNGQTDSVFISFKVAWFLQAKNLPGQTAVSLSFCCRAQQLSSKSPKFLFRIVF